MPRWRRPPSRSCSSLNWSISDSFPRTGPPPWKRTASWARTRGAPRRIWGRRCWKHCRTPASRAFARCSGRPRVDNAGEGGRFGYEERTSEWDGRRRATSLKLTYIGAGSAVFARQLMTDILAVDGLDGGTFALVDVDIERLEVARQLAEILVKRS